MAEEARDRHDKPFDVLDQFTARRSDDDVKRELELTCNTCGTIVCDVEDGDLLSVLADVVDDHWEEFHFQLPGA